jgi:probable phosphoglycerate mutase
MLTAYTDGGARGNPGPAGYGVLIEDDQGRTIAELKGALGRATNNVAEYAALIAALRYALDHGHRHLRVRSDSLLIVQQMKGIYRVKHPGLQPLHEEAVRLARRLQRVDLEHVPRAANARADALANQAMDEAARNGPVESAGGRTPGENHRV